MSRLDSFIRRLEAQRACLDFGMGLVRDRFGVVLELGLGNGRTYHHLREGLPNHEIFVFEREPRANPASMPDDQHLVVGDLCETLVRFRAVLPHAAVLAHSDIGTGVAEIDRRLAAKIAELMPPLLAENAVVLSDQRLSDDGLEPLPLPETVSSERYFIYQKKAGSHCGAP